MDTGSATIGPTGRVVVIGLAETAFPLAERLRRTRLADCVGVALAKSETGKTPPPSPGGEIYPPALGSIDDLPALRDRLGFDVALVSIPLAMSELIERVRSAVEAIDVAFRFQPTLDDALCGWHAVAPASACSSAFGARACHTTGTMTGETPVPLQPQLLAHLLGRESRPIDPGLARRALAGRRVLITGAGGSIGAELARLAASFSPAELTLMDRSENALFQIDREIAATHPDIRRRALLHDVVEPDATLHHLAAIRPEVIFHAAAHKHVPMMEDHPAHAVNNNLFGAKSVADAALAVGAERFVLISTDKAVNPSSVMGATKRFAEQYVRAMNSRGPTRFSAVRFGNVLGSSGSVLTIWRNQVAAGGPVTITDPRMTRYFMTIPEAAALVIQSAGLSETEAGGAEVLVLDMGEPVRIVDLARRFVRACGLAPIGPADENEQESVNAACSWRPKIALTTTGARPGEKIHEQLTHDRDRLAPTAVPGVLAWSGEAVEPVSVMQMVADLGSVRRSPDSEAVLRAVHRWLKPAGHRGLHPEVEASAAGAA